MEHDFHFANHVVCIVIDKLLEKMANREISSKDAQCVEYGAMDQLIVLKIGIWHGECKILVY